MIPSGERDVKVPSFDVLLTCAKESEVKLVLETKSTWKDSFVSRNFIVVSPMIASSIASLDHSASALTVLSEVIKTIRDLHLISKDNSGNLQEPITKLITFLIARAVDEMNKGEDKDEMLPVNVDIASEVEQQEYKKSISNLLPNPNNDKNNETNQDKTINKKRDRPQQATDDDNNNNDEDSITE